MDDVGELEPGRGDFELFEEVAEGDAEADLFDGGDVDVEREALVGHGLEQEVHVAAGEAERLAAQLGHGDEVAGRRRADYFVDGGFGLAVLCGSK